MTEITVTVSGPVGCGKSAIAGEIEIALRAIGVPVRHADPKADLSEKNMTGADWQSYLEMYQPSVVLAEQLLRARKPRFGALKRWWSALFPASPHKTADRD